MMPASDAVGTMLLLALLYIRGATAQQCTACEDGSLQTEPPDKVINVPAFGRRTCAEIAGFAALLPSSGDHCPALQALGSLCGCPIAENACRLCGRGDEGTVLAVSRPTVTLEGVFYRDFVSSSARPESSESINCETLQAVLHSHEQDSDLCLRSQSEHAEVCGCQALDGSDPGDTNSSKPQDESSTASLPSPQNSSSGPQPAFSQCSLCPDGSQTKVLNKTIELGDGFPAKNCIQLAGLMGLIPAKAGQCQQLQFFGTYCGCPIPEDTCTVCANGDPILYPDVRLDFFKPGSSFYSSVGLPEGLRAISDGFNCEILQSAMHAVGLWDNFNGFGSDALCLITQHKTSICGCDPPRYAVAVVWSYRAAAILSLLGSTLILYDVLSRPKKRSSTYHQLIIGISCFDLVSSTGYALTGVLNPKADGMYSARGNESTCKFQSFIIQLGLMVSISYNVFLSLYYLFVVKYNWKEFRFRKYRHYVHAAVLFFGSIMASAAFPFYGEQGVVCHIVSAPRAESELPITFFYTIPLSIALVFITAASVALCWTVYKQERRGMQWSLRQNKNLKLTKKVVKQSLLYAASFYLTIPLAIMGYYIEFRSARTYTLTLGLSAVSAGQGFLNALVYFYRRGDVPMSSRVKCVLKSVRASVPWPRSTDRKKTDPLVNDSPDPTSNEISENVVSQNAVSENVDSLEREKDIPTGQELERVSESDQASRLNLAVDQASSTQGNFEGDAGVVNDADADFGQFDAAAEHWLSTQDDGKLRLPKRPDFGTVFHHQEPLQDQEPVTDPAC